MLNAERQKKGAMMKYQDRWEVLEAVGKGGQGEVYRVRDKTKPSLDLVDFFRALENGINLKKGMESADKRSKKGHLRELFYDSNLGIKDSLEKAVKELVGAEDFSNQGALKVLRTPNEARNFGDSEERLKREIEAMESISHPNLLKVEDYSTDEKWFVSKYYSQGTLQKRLGLFTGRLEEALTAILPVVDGVAKLHEKKRVHRDIKPENIFVDDNEELVLGDFGLVFFSDRQQTRLSGTFENVGSYDWMAPWARNIQLEEVTPKSDVFSLGKVIWSMVANRPIFPHWNHRKNEHNVQVMFGDKPEMEFLNRLLDKCIVEEAEDCTLIDAGYLGRWINMILESLRMGADPIEKVRRRCRVCGLGRYKQIADFKETDIERLKFFGLRPERLATFNIFTCNTCGHVQLFFSPNNEEVPRAWEHLYRELLE